MTIGRRLRERREAAGLTGDDVTARGGPGKSYLSQLETGSRGPNSWPLIAMLARIYNTSTDYLLGLTDDPAPASGRNMPPHGDEVLAAMRLLGPVYQAQLAEIATMFVRTSRSEDLWYEIRDGFVERIGDAATVELSEMLAAGIAAGLDEDTVIAQFEDILDWWRRVLKKRQSNGH